MTTATHMLIADQTALRAGSVIVRAMSVGNEAKAKPTARTVPALPKQSK